MLMDAPLEYSGKQLGLDAVALLRARCLQQFHQEGERRLWRQSCQSFNSTVAQHHMSVAAGNLYETAPMLAKGDFRTLAFKPCPRRYAACHRSAPLQATIAIRVKASAR